MEESEEMTHHLPRLLWDDLLSLCSFITSHPLQFSYLLFFSPYLFQIISFLYPLLLSTSLFLLALLTVPSHPSDPPAASPAGAFGSTCRRVLDLLKARLDGDTGFHPFEHLGSMVPELEASVEAVPIEETRSKGGVREEVVVFEALSIDGFFGWELETLGKLYKALACYEIGDYPIKLALPNPEKNGLLVSDLEIENRAKPGKYRLSEENLSKTPPALKNWEMPATDTDESEFGSPCLVPDSPISPVELKGLDRFGSARKEKEWKRTLACKLYEEQRMVENGGEGMDLLWEEDESDTLKENKEATKATKKKEDKGKKAKAKKYDPDEEDEEEEEEEEMTGRFCCLQALKFSSGKMNLGMGRSKLMKISKTFKGMGIFTKKKRNRNVSPWQAQ